VNAKVAAQSEGGRALDVSCKSLIAGYTGWLDAHRPSISASSATFATDWAAACQFVEQACLRLNSLAATCVRKQYVPRLARSEIQQSIADLENDERRIVAFLDDIPGFLRRAHVSEETARMSLTAQKQRIEKLLRHNRQALSKLGVDEQHARQYRGFCAIPAVLKDDFIVLYVADVFAVYTREHVLECVFLIHDDEEVACETCASATFSEQGEKDWLEDAVRRMCGHAKREIARRLGHELRTCGFGEEK
jgi:hypothetical protein